jgi:hypothetical protein
MRRAVNICCAGVLTLMGLSGIGIDAASAQIFRSNPSPTSPETQGNTGSALTFQPDAANVRFQINLKRAIATSVDNQTVLDGKDLGPISIQSNLGSGDRIDAYQWSISPTSRLYLSPSGYKSLVAKYQYKDAGQSYNLNIFCQSRGIRQNKAACKLFGDGPLLNGETKASGQLAIRDPIAEVTNWDCWMPNKNASAILPVTRLNTTVHRKQSSAKGMTMATKI